MAKRYLFKKNLSVLFTELGINNSQQTNTYECKNINHETMLKKILMAFSYILEFLIQNIKNTYQQFIS